MALSKIFLICWQALIETPFVRINDRCGHNLLRTCGDLHQNFRLISGSRPTDGTKKNVVERRERNSVTSKKGECFPDVSG